jgi:hypothetical protein
MEKFIFFTVTIPIVSHGKVLSLFKVISLFCGNQCAVMGVRDIGIDGEFLVTLRHGNIEKRTTTKGIKNNVSVEEFFFYVTPLHNQEISFIEITVYNSTISAGIPLFFSFFKSPRCQ